MGTFRTKIVLRYEWKHNKICHFYASRCNYAAYLKFAYGKEAGFTSNRYTLLWTVQRMQSPELNSYFSFLPLVEFI